MRQDKADAMPGSCPYRRLADDYELVQLATKVGGHSGHAAPGKSRRQEAVPGNIAFLKYLWVEAAALSLYHPKRAFMKTATWEAGSVAGKSTRLAQKDIEKGIASQYSIE